MGVHGVSEKLLTFVVLATGQNGLLFGLGQRREKHGGKNGYNSDHDKQF